MNRNFAALTVACVVAVAGCSSSHNQTTDAPTTVSAATTTVAIAPTSSEPPTTISPDTTVAGIGAPPAPLVGLAAGSAAWQPAVNVGGRTIVWTIRNQQVTGSPTVRLSVAEFDQRSLRAALFNGYKLPGGGPWKNGDRVPPSAVPALVAAFNGGFLFKDTDGGYVTEGRVVRPLRVGRATIGIRRDGSIDIGDYGSGMTNDGSWISLRQNLRPVVVNGKEVVAGLPEFGFGDDFHHVLATFRSALCQRDDGRYLYVVMGPVRVRALADELVTMGCQFGMQLDITGTWPQFSWYSGFGTTTRQGVMLDSRMGNPGRYLTGSQKDFIALFDPATLPSTALP